ncbi:hypothetical protein N7447_010459 [Penicillium robsamsonii]|uniref:uncharacterized protein n=1 Tax=Penicillium robsamsonii TaxID=1792511 RepID=UPI002548A0A7|nr:uncharacterized protein N7447_010459 [Penicillium robsamsonii]KAJ5810943.1 hypothetical protein N7447_010459 [Penicillium robsamsonii]
MTDILNFSTSSRIYLLEPQWNPSIEAQAIGRALRLGQVSNVTIVRYIMEGTVEESNVSSRQRKKLQQRADSKNQIAPHLTGYSHCW